MRHFIQPDLDRHGRARQALKFPMRTFYYYQVPKVGIISARCMSLRLFYVSFSLTCSGAG